MGMTAPINKGEHSCLDIYMRSNFQLADHPASKFHMIRESVETGQQYGVKLMTPILGSFSP